MEFEFDPAKNAANLAKHGVPLLFGARVFDDPAVAAIDTIRAGDEELRYKAIGTIDGRLWTAVHVRRGTVVRLISVRRSNANERRDYGRAEG
ncbi:MAG: BrnT family toxin [Janthinobacterium lividum]